MTQMNYQTLCKMKGQPGKVEKLTTAEGMPLDDKNFFAQRLCDEFTYAWDAEKNKWAPYHLISYLPWHVQHLISTGEISIVHDCSQVLVETLRRLEVKLSRKEESCGPSSLHPKDPKSLTPKQEEPSAPSPAMETSDEPSHGLF